MTTVGIIDAKIELDAAGFMAKIEEVKAAVADLSHERVTIQIDVDVSRALAKIEEIRAAAAGAEHVNPALGGAGGALGGSNGSTAGTAAATAATDALAGAQRREAASAAEAEVAESRLRTSVVETAAATEAAAAVERNAASGASSSESRVAEARRLDSEAARLQGEATRAVAAAQNAQANAARLAGVAERAKAGGTNLSAEADRLAQEAARAVAAAEAGHAEAARTAQVAERLKAAAVTQSADASRGLHSAEQTAVSDANRLVQAKIAASAAAARVTGALRQERQAVADLSTVNKFGTATAEQMAAAESRVATAHKNVEILSRRAAAASADLGNEEARIKGEAEAAAHAAEQLATSHRSVAAAAVRDASATRSAAESVTSFGNASGGASTRTMLIASAVGFLVAAIAPLGAYAIGAIGALGGMGAAGVLAFIGIKNAITAGTAEGMRFEAGLGTLKGDLDRLSATSAHAIAPGFFQTIHEIQAAMPMLNASMGGFGRILGSTVVAGVGAVLNIIRQLNPLFLITAVAVRDLARSFQSWTAGKQLQQFGDYAISVLPRVGQILGDIVKAAFDLAAALAPLGMVLLNMVDAIVNVLDAFARMGPLLSYVAGGALIALAAFKGWAFIAPMIDRVSASLLGVRVATTAALGPIGAIAAGLTLVGFVVDRASHAYNTGAIGVTQYSNALLNSNGHVDQAINKVTALQVKTQALGPSLRIAGVSQATFSAAVLRGGSAIDQMVAKMRNANEGARTFAVGAGRMVNAQNQVELGARRLSQGVQQAVQAYNQYRVSVGLAGNQTARQLDAQTQLAARMHTTVGVLTAAQAAQKQTATQAAVAATQFRLEGDAAGLLNAQLQKLNGAALSDAQAMASWASSVKSLSLQSDHGRVALTGMSQAALINRGAIASTVQAADGAIAAYADTARTGAQVTAEWGRMKAAMISQAVAAGANRAQVTALVNAYFKLPKNVQTKIELKDQQAKSALATTTAAINKFTGAPHVAKITGNNTDALGKTNAAQAFVDKFARGNYTAQEKANASNALSVTQAAMAKALGFSRAQYMAILRANNGAALSSTSTAQQRARAFATAAYQAILRANPGPANSASAGAQAIASRFAHAFYQAILRGDASQAIAAVNAAKAAVRSFNGMSAVSRITVIHTNETINKRLGRAHGGTIGAATGLTAGWEGGSIRGPGAAAADMAGVYALANGEEVISNMQGQADRWRPLLKAINAGRVSMSTFEQLGLHAPAGGRGRGSEPSRQVNLGGIHIHHPVTQDPVTSAQHAAQSILAYVNYP